MSGASHTGFRGGGWRDVVSRCNLISLGLLLDLILFAPPLLLLQEAPRLLPWANGLLAAAIAARLALLALALWLKLRRLALGLVITILLSPAGLLLAPLAMGILCGPKPDFFPSRGGRSPPAPPPPVAPFRSTLRLTDEAGSALPGVTVLLNLSPDRGNEPRKSLTLLSDEGGMIAVDSGPAAYHSAELKTPDHPAPDGWYYQNRDRWSFWFDEKKGWTLHGDREEQKEMALRWQTAGLLTLVMAKGEPPDRMLKRRPVLHAPYHDALTRSYDVIADEWREGDCPDCDFTLRIEGCESQCGAQQQYDARRMRVTVTAGPGGGVLPYSSDGRAERPERVPETGLVRQADFVANQCNLGGRFLFTSRAGKLNGRVGLNLNCPYRNRGNTPDKPPEWGSIEVIANPRGSRNLRHPDNSYGDHLTGPDRPFLQDKHLDLNRVRVTRSGEDWVIRGDAGAANRGLEVSAPESYGKVYTDGTFEIKTVRKPDAWILLKYDWPKGCENDCDQERFPVAWLPGARVSGSVAVIPVSRAREFLPLIGDPVCPEGRVLADVKDGYCCWPGQRWEDQHCAGTPQRCPRGLKPEENLCAGAWVFIPAGEFQMGCVPQDHACAKDELPRHRVRISRGFWMMRRLMTEYEGLKFSRRWLADQMAPEGYMDALPFSDFSFSAAQRFCGELGGRLPTEAEWEYAARGGRETIFTVGDSFDYDPEKFSDLKGFPHTDHIGPVDWNPPDAFGLLDMAGNKPVWTSDFYDPDYYLRAPVADPAGPDRGADHVMRGASQFDHPPAFRLSRRIPGDSGRYTAALRCVRDTPPADPNRLLP